MARAETAPRIYIWITRWIDFQHYTPERDRAPAWIKTLTKQLDDDNYRALTPVQRGVLHDLRLTFARAHGKLAIGTREVHENTVTGARETRDSFTSGTRALTHRLGYRVTSVQLKALNDAGFIQFVSREGLEERLERFYASRVRDRAHHQEVEVEREEEDLLTSSCDLDAADPDEEPGPDDEPLNTTTKNGSHSLDKINFKSYVPNLDLEP